MKRYRGTPHDPFETVLCLVFGTSATAQLLTGPPAMSVAATMPNSWRLLWLVLLLLGCVVTLTGSFCQRVWGYMVEQIGLAAAGWSLIAYGSQILIIQIDRGTFTSNVLGAPLVLALGLAFLWKQRQIWNTIRRFNEMESGPPYDLG